jgi:structural maintenance of chromosome 3 (chondroitin sulfate proteoglycan 6)
LTLIRRDLWREDGKLGQTVSNAKAELDSAERALQGMMDKVDLPQFHSQQDVSHGIRAVRSIAARLGLEGVYGPVYDLFEVPDRYKTAVEAVAGSR